MHEILEKIGELGLVPVVKIERAEDALHLGKALIEGDLPVAEITFRTAAAAVGCCFGTALKIQPYLLRPALIASLCLHR